MILHVNMVFVSPLGHVVVLVHGEADTAILVSTMCRLSAAILEVIVSFIVGFCAARCSPACQNGGVCNSDHQCTCSPEWSGDYCQQCE